MEVGAEILAGVDVKLGHFAEDHTETEDEFKNGGRLADAEKDPPDGEIPVPVTMMLQDVEAEGKALVMTEEEIIGVDDADAELVEKLRGSDDDENAEVEDSSDEDEEPIVIDGEPLRLRKELAETDEALLLPAQV